MVFIIFFLDHFSSSFLGQKCKNFTHIPFWQGKWRWNGVENSNESHMFFLSGIWCYLAKSDGNSRISKRNPIGITDAFACLGGQYHNVCGLSLKRKPVKEKKGIGNPSNVWNFRLLKTMRILEQVQLFFTSFEFWDFLGGFT